MMRVFGQTYYYRMAVGEQKRFATEYWIYISWCCYREDRQVKMHFIFYIFYISLHRKT